VLHEEPRPRATRPAVAVAEPVSLASSPTLQPAEAPPREATVTPADLEWKRALDPLVVGERYPMLRTTL
jgi:hypothetical protein